MLKKKTKLIVLLFALIILISGISFATDDTTPGENARTADEPVTTAEVTDNTSNEDIVSTTEEPEIYSGDLYLFGGDIVMDKLVDGNVFLAGNDVKITGRVNGSLFVIGNKVTFEEDTYVVQSIYACAQELNLNGSANDLYAAANTVNMSYDSFMIRDLRVMANTFNFSGGVGRDAFVNANNFNFTTEGDKTAVVYGNLDYTSSNELSLGDELVQGDIHYSKYTEKEKPSTSDIILDKVMDFLRTLIFTVAVFLLAMWLAPKFIEKSSEFVSTKALIALAAGVATIIATVIASIILAITSVGVPLAIAVFALLLIMLSIAFAVTTTCITCKIKEQFKFEKKYLTLATLSGVTLVLWLLKQIPVVGVVISILISLVGLGVIITYLFSKTKKVEEN